MCKVCGDEADKHKAREVQAAETMGEEKLKTEGYQQWHMVQRRQSWEQRESATSTVVAAGGDREASFMWLSK